MPAVRNEHYLAGQALRFLIVVAAALRAMSSAAASGLAF